MQIIDEENEIKFLFNGRMNNLEEYLGIIFDISTFRLYKDKDVLKRLLIHYHQFSNFLPEEFIKELNQEKGQKSVKSIF